jgi:hypothetical protein
MQINWLFDKKFTANYYIRQAQQIHAGFFQNIRALILPRLHPDAWFFPDYGFFKDQDFLKHLEKLNHNFNLVVNDQSLVDKVTQKLDLFVNELDITEDKKSFDQIFPKITEFTKAFFLNIDSVYNLNIIPVRFGTGSSYYYQLNEKGYEIYITYRIDKKYTFIIKSFISVMVKIEKEFNDDKFDEWTARKTISDFLFNNTALKQYFPETENNGAIEFLEEYKGEIAQESAKYLAELGHPLPKSFSYKNDTIYFNSEPLQDLENKEIEVLKYLIDHRSQICSFEQIGDIYWGDQAQDKYSLEALAKLIEKIRKSFQRNNIPVRCLQTVRKKGYLLYD